MGTQQTGHRPAAWKLRVSAAGTILALLTVLVAWQVAPGRYLGQPLLPGWHGWTWKGGVTVAFLAAFWLSLRVPVREQPLWLRRLHRLVWWAMLGGMVTYLLPPLLR
ncbi:MAG: hypothetical protein OWV35_07675 [Firmicutes bacterium]|nr:hypothetical protein [Bacillota bacterium]